MFIPIHNTEMLNQTLRQMVINYFYAKDLITKSFDQNPLSWKNSGFSIKNSFRIYGFKDRTRESIGQYLAQAPISLQRIECIKEKGKVICCFYFSKTATYQM